MMLWYITVINFRDTASYHTVITSKNSANCSGGPVDSVAQKPPSNNQYGPSPATIRASANAGFFASTVEVLL